MRIINFATIVFGLAFMFLNVNLSAADTLTTNEVETLYNNYFNPTNYRHVTVHDPSVVIGYEKGDSVTGEYSEGASKEYYIFGSHMAWARTTDLKNWSTFNNNINALYSSIFSVPAAWSKKGSTTYNLSGNLWAPDIIWNKDMKKWCLYMSVNGDYWYSSVVLLTSDEPNGDWTYVGPVVYSGFTNQSQANETDFYDVVDPAGGFPSRYNLNRNGVHTYGTNAIDPCVFYDEDGNLWMTYGSWFGGMYILRLDAETGLRDYTYTYTTTDGTSTGATSDEYQGIKIAHGDHRSGEASYIQYINDKYYLFITNGGLAAAGGYNMRVYASETVLGPYKDMTGQEARFSLTNTDAGKVNGNVGLRLMSYYKWGWLDNGFTAQGHNSAMVDDDGKSYLVFHTRFDDGSEGHQVRVHQLFQTKNGFLATAPFEYADETLATESYPENDVVGHYGILYHGNGTNHQALECVQEQEISLNADGSVSGAYTGTWSQAVDGPYITIAVNGITFQGVLITQKMQELDITTLCFTAVGNDVSLWGYKMAGEGKPFPEDATVAYNVKNLSGLIPTTVYSQSQLTLPSKGQYGATYSWSWDTTLISSDGVVKEVTSDGTTDLLLTVSCGDYIYTSTSTIQLSSSGIADMLPIGQDAILQTYANISSFNTATPNSSISSSTGLSLSFYLENITSDWDAIAHSTDNSYILYLSVLHYNNADFYEAVATLSPAAIAAGFTSSTAWEIFLNTSCYVTVSFNTDGTISYYKDGELMLTFAASTAPSWGSGVTPASIATAVINYYKSGRLLFDLDVKNVVVGYAVGNSNVGIEEITKADFDFDGELEVYNISGVRIAYGKLSSMELPTGVYIVRKGNQARKIMIKSW